MTWFRGRTTALAAALVVAALALLIVSGLLAASAEARSRPAFVPIRGTVSYGVLGTYSVRGLATVYPTDPVYPSDPIFPAGSFYPTDPIYPSDPVYPSDPIYPGDPIRLQTIVGAVARNTTNGRQCLVGDARLAELTYTVAPMPFVRTYRYLPRSATCSALGSLALDYSVTMAPSGLFTAVSAAAVISESPSP